MYLNVYKPAIDFILSLVLLVFFSPLLLIVILLLFITNNGNPFFTQKRPGKNGKIFKIIKLKTMNDKRDIKGDLLSDYKRLTPIGKYVRALSLDELPQLFNVLKGDMSLVEPRPLLPEYLPLYNNFQKRRHEVKPGITGWAQVNGRNALKWDEKFKYDVEYVDSISFKKDFKIILNTVSKVVKRKGVNTNNFVTSEAFKGNTI